MASCNYILQITFNNVFYLIGSIGLDECNGKLMEDVKSPKSCGEISYPKMMKMYYSLVIREVQ